jgi:hypothetical protein
MNLRLFLNTFVVLVLCACSSSGHKRDPSSAWEEINCELLPKGCLISRNSEKLIIFFRGWVAPNLAKKYGGERGRLHEKSWTKSARDLAFEDLRLFNIALNSSLFITGSSHVDLSSKELKKLLEESGAQEIILASHSGGYVGMRTTILAMSGALKEKVTGIWMLDNFYGGAPFAQDLERNFGRQFLRQNCYGFLTEHNRARFNSSYASLCPHTLGHGVTHSSGVSQCMPFYESSLPCKARR